MINEENYTEFEITQFKTREMIIADRYVLKANIEDQIIYKIICTT